MVPAQTPTPQPGTCPGSRKTRINHEAILADLSQACTSWKKRLNERSKEILNQNWLARCLKYVMSMYFKLMCSSISLARSVAHPTVCTYCVVSKSNYCPSKILAHSFYHRSIRSNRCVYARSTWWHATINQSCLHDELGASHCWNREATSSGYVDCKNVFRVHVHQVTTKIHAS